jgi:hypothetical protein
MDKRLSIKEVGGRLKIKEYLSGGNKNSVTFKTDINPKDFKQIGRLLIDFELQGYPVEKGIKELKSLKHDNSFPLW